MISRVRMSACGVLLARRAPTNDTQSVLHPLVTDTAALTTRLNSRCRAPPHASSKRRLHWNYKCLLFKLNMAEHWTETDDRALRVAVLDLSRLLRCMERHEAPPDLSWQSIDGRANLAQDLWRNVQDGFHAAVYENNTLRAADEARYGQLEQQVDRACRRAREIAAERRANQVDLIQEIFFPKQDNVVMNEEEKKDNDVDENSVEHDGHEPASQEEQQQESPEASAPFVPKSSAQDVEELQKAQREQLEAEISHMAARLKESTQQMNTTLRTQTEVRNNVSYMYSIS